MLIGANLPDLDVLAYLGGPAADLSFRRGWTHGVLALAVLPFLLTAVVLSSDALVRRLGRATLPSTVVPRQVLFLSACSILTHPILDSLNTYGVRWLMPFSGRWFYGDALFIVDPWLWLALGLGLCLGRSRRRSRKNVLAAARSARLGLLIATAYSIGMAVSGAVAGRLATGELTTLTGEPVEALMAGPLPVTPLVRDIVAVQPNGYRVARFHWLRHPHLDPGTLRSFHRGTPASMEAQSAARTLTGRRFLGWARFPVFRTESRPDGAALVHIFDLRYTDRPGVGFGAVTIPVMIPPASGSSGDSLPSSSAGGPAAPVP